MSTLSLIIVENGVCADSIESAVARAQGRATLVVTSGFDDVISDHCLTHACTYVSLKSSCMGLVCAFLLPFEFVEVTHIVSDGDCAALQLCTTDTKALCNKDFFVCAKGADVDVSIKLYENVPRNFESHLFCDRVARGNNTVLIRREWLLGILKTLKAPAKNLLDELLTHSRRRAVSQCIAERIVAPETTCCVCIFAFDRPHYFSQLVDSLVAQITDEHVVMFLDGPTPRHSEADTRRIQQNVEVLHRRIPWAKINKARNNQCVAQNQWWGLTTVFCQAQYSRAIIMEDDVVLGTNALRSVYNMMPLLDVIASSIAINLGYRNYDDKLLLRIVDPYPSEDDVKDGCRQIHDHLHYWAWATSRKKFMLMKKDYDYFFHTFFRNVVYAQRKVHAIMTAVRRRGIYTQHGSQDWTRHNCFKMNGMHHHIVPSRRLVVPIGVEGFHCNEQIFTKRLGLDNTRSDVHNAVIPVTTPFHHVHSIGIHPSLLKTHDWLTKLGYTRWSNLHQVPILFVPDNAECDSPNAVKIGEHDTSDSRPWVRYVNACVRQARIKSM